MKSNKGITLVALVITIIVLLILAGVSISLVVGDNGVLTQSQNAAEKTDEADAKQALEMAISSCQGDFISEWSNNTQQNFFVNYLSAHLVAAAQTEGYTLAWDSGKAPATAGTAAEGTMKKGTSGTTTSEYSFKIVDSGAMGAKVSEFKKTK